MIGQTISHYRVTGKLGEGGMGVVYRADDLSLDRQVALKVLPSQLSDVPQARARLLREAKAASALQHPNICSIHEIGTTDDGDMFMVMPCYEGESLRERLDREPLDIDEAIEIGRQIGSALSATHAKGILHRDIKPGNVMLTNGGSQAVLMDFGLAKPDDATQITRTGAAVGTIAYMSPEQLRGEEVDSRSDLWSLGVLLYEMVTGQRPFNAGGEAGLFDSILHDDPVAATELKPETPAALAAMIDRMLAKSPSKRMSDASTVTETLKGARVLEAPFTWHARQWVKRHRQALQSTGTILIVATAFLTWQFWPATEEFRGIAVLPFEDLSEQGDQEWFCDGMTDAVIQSLGEVGVPGVISRTSTARYADSGLSISEIAGELDTDAVVEASILQIGDLVRINARLFRGDTEEQLWADSFEREMKNVLQLHSEIARAIAEKINVAINPDAGSDREVDPEAFRHYLRGRHWFGAMEAEKTLESYEEAVRIDPAFAEGWAGLAQYHVQMLHGNDPIDMHVGPARAALEKAFEIDPDLQFAHSVSAHLAWEHEWDFDKASHAFERALELNPSDDYIWLVKSYWLLARRRFDGAADASLEVIRLDPFSGFAYFAAPTTLVASGRYDKALEVLDTGTTRFPSWQGQPFFTMQRVDIYLEKGEVDSAFAILETMPLADRWASHVNRLAELGRMDEAHALLDEILRTLPEAEISEWDLARVSAFLGEREGFARHMAQVTGLGPEGRIAAAALYAVVGDLDTCFELLEKEYDRRNLWLRMINHTNWIWEPLHTDPRFQSLIERMGLDR